MKRIIYTFIIAIFAITAQAQSGPISGSVIDGLQSPVGYANVLLLQSADSTLYKGALTDDSGIYTFDQVSIGSYIISSTMVGFSDTYSDIIVFDGSTPITIAPLILTEGITMDQVTVTASKPFIELKADKMIVNVSNSSVNVGNSALEVLKKSPGVIIDNNDQISLRGKQGVLVTINGKNQYLSGDEITRLLETMPSSSIESIEIIVNPSAKYDAEGNSGIINIVLKKNENLGSNGSISSTLRQGIMTSHFHEMNLNYRSNNINVYGGGEYYNWGWTQDLSLIRNIPLNGGSTLFDQVSKMFEEGDGYNAKLGMDWNITNNTTLSLLAKKNQGDEQDDNNTTTNISGNNMPNFDNLEVIVFGDEDYNKDTYNANINHKFNDKGFELTLDADISNFQQNSIWKYDNFYKNESGEQVNLPYYLRNNQDTKIDIFASTIDLAVPVHQNLNMEIGAKISDVTTDNSTLFEFLDSETIWTNDATRSNDFKYSEEVYAGYVNASGNISTFSIQAGLRMEHTKSEGISITLNSSVPRSYTNFFPSLSISKSINEKHNLSLSYSRRLERPNYGNLNPFENYLDQYTSSRGNPFLNPQYSQTLGINYMMGRSLFVGVNYSRTTDAIQSVIEQISSENKTFQTNQNLDTYNNFSISVSAPKVWSEAWTSRFNYNGFYNGFKSIIPSGTLDNNNIAHVLQVNNEIKLPYDWNMELSGQYQTKVVFGLFVKDPESSIDFGLSKKILNNRGAVKLSVSDIFRQRNSPVRVMQDDIDLFVNEKRDTRRVTLNFSYSFGNQKVKAAKNRKTSTADEQGRI